MCISKLAAFVLLSAVASLPWAGQAIPRVAAASQSGGCHHGGEKIPLPQPTNYSCCQAGHNSAILQAKYAQDIAVAGILPEATLASPEPAPQVPSNEQVFPTYQPPGGLPLRI